MDGGLSYEALHDNCSRDEALRPACSGGTLDDATVRDCMKAKGYTIEMEAR